ncbi:MAG: site-specific integrase [Actinomycetota bacterium]|nr:site-specific integrase [Actinomycetota bacterium]
MFESVAAQRQSRESAAEMTTGQYLTEWLVSVAPGGSIRPTTAKAYAVAIRVHVIPRLGRVPLQQLSRKLVKELYDHLFLHGRARPPRGGLSIKAVHNIHLTLHRALEDAVDDGLLRSNPTTRAHRMGHSLTTVRCWTPAELRSFVEGLRADPDFALWRLAAATGMRRGELLGLMWRDFDFRLGRVTIQRQLIRNGDRIEFAHPKTAAGRRTICLDTVTIVALLERRRGLAMDTNDVNAGLRDGLVFGRQDGRPRDPDAVTNKFRAEVKRAGLPRIRLHDLRHTHATIALQAAINPKVVQERLGHASVRVTLDTYTHVLQPMHGEAASRIAALVDGAG